MRDALNNFGTIALAGGTTTVVLPNIIDFGPIDDRSPLTSHRTGAQHDATVVFAIDGDLSAAATGIKLGHSDDNSTFTDLVTAPNFAAAARAGDRITLKFPLEHKRYVRASATAGTGGVNISAWVEPGPNS
jgi:hypothetical protein